MAKYSGNWTSITHTATANTTNLVDSTYSFFLQGGSATQRLEISEIYIGGESAAALACTFKFSRDTTVAATGISGVNNTLTDASATAPGTLAVIGNVATTKPQRGTGTLLSLSINTYGGVMRWVASPDQKITVVTATQPLGEASLSSLTGAGISSGHVLYEVV